MRGVRRSLSPEFEARETGDTALIRAAWLGHEDVVHFLIFLGCEIDYQSSTGATALNEAAKVRRRPGAGSSWSP